MKDPADCKPKYKHPYFLDKSVRSMKAEILVAGEYQECIINAGAPETGYVNADYDAIMEEYGEEELDRLTALVNDIESEKLERHEEQKTIQLNRMKQETLFNIKLEAFEIEIVKNSKNKELKKLIRKAKTPLEVQAYTTILIQKEMDTHE
jgi:hypothetical protein|tara:strand:- start:752 stop:1201 length:450 start_codon:yes stop_codon:yes gene_type:complete